MKKFWNPRKIAAVLVMTIFALSGLIGGAFAPVFNRMVTAASGTANTVVSNYVIKGLPRKSLLVGTDIDDPSRGASLPSLYSRAASADFDTEINDERVRLYRVNTSGLIEIERADWATAKYEVGTYQWRFYNEPAAEPGEHFHWHEVKVAQKDYTFTVPSSARDTKGTATVDDDELNFLPTLMMTNMDITLPLPTAFSDRKGNNLFTDFDGVVTLREEVLKDLPGFADDFGDGSKTWTDLENFKSIIFKNTVLRFYGSDGEQENAAEVSAADLTANGGEYATASDAKDGEELTYKNLTVAGARTFRPTVAATYNAEYEFMHTSIEARFETATPISAERTTGKNLTFEQVTGATGTNDEKKANQIRFSMPPAVSKNADPIINQPYTLNQPTVSLSSETNKDNEGYNPVRFSSTTAPIASYTFVEVLRVGLDNKENKAEYDNSKPIRIDERGSFDFDGNQLTNTPYTFVPQLPGSYSFRYYTTTIFGVGYIAHIENKETKVVGGDTYYVYLPDSLQTITSNTVRPEIKWTVPYKYAVAEDAAVTGGDAKVNDSIPTADYSALFDVNTSTVLQRYGDKTFFDQAPNLDSYMPYRLATSSTEVPTNVTEVEAGGKLVLPALLGQNNIDQASKLKYYLTLSRYENNVRKETQTFSNDTSITSYKTHDFTTPFVVDFSDPETYSDTGILSAFPIENKKSQYRIEVYALDNSPDIFTLPNNAGTSYGRSSDTMYYVFNVVETTGMDGADARPNFTDFNLTQKSYYQDDIISFNTLNPQDTYTQSTQIDVKYYLLYNDETILIDKSLVNTSSGRVTFSLSEDNLAARPILIALNDDPSNTKGVLDLNIAAVGKNYYSLINAQTDFVQKGADEIFTEEDLEAYVQNPTAWKKMIDDDDDGTTPAVPDETATETVLKGLTVKITPIRMYAWDYGASAVIGLEGAAGDTDGAPVSEVSDLNTTWRTKFVTGTAPDDVTTVEQYKIVEFPVFTVGYLASELTASGITGYRTDVEFKVILPRNGGEVGVIGNSSVELGVKTARTPIDNVRFYTQKIGLHTLVCTVKTGEGYVSVFTAQFNVIGETQIEPTIQSGRTTAQVGETVPLPAAKLKIDNQDFETVDNDENIMAIHMVNAPDQVVNPTPDSDPLTDDEIIDYNATAHSDMLYVGTYTLSGMRINGGARVPVRDGHFTAEVAGTYEFTYTFYLDAPALADLMIEAGTLAKAPSATHTVVVSELVSGDITFKADENNYKALRTIDEYTKPGETDPTVNNDPATAAVDNIGFNNVLDRLVTAADGRVNMSPRDISGAMVLAEAADANADTDLYQYGRIYLPNFYAQWIDTDAKSLDGFTIDVPSLSRVTVQHSADASGVYIFDSYNIDKGTKNETQYIDTANGRFYYFQPQGKARVPEDTPVEERYERSTSEDGVTPDGTYTITYTIVFQNITFTKTFTLGYGDIAKPIIYLDTDVENDLFANDKYNLTDKKVFSVSTKDIHVMSNGGTITPMNTDTDYVDWYVGKNVRMSVRLPGASTWMEIGEDDNDIHATPSIADDSTFGADAGQNKERTWSFTFTESGEYLIRFDIKSATGQTATSYDRSIVIPEPEAKTEFPQAAIWGIILIILAVVLLVAAVWYFIQTGRASKFAAAGGTKPLTAKKAKAPKADAKEKTIDEAAEKPKTRTLNKSEDAPEKDAE